MRHTEREMEIGRAIAQAMADSPMRQGPDGESIRPGDPLPVEPALEPDPEPDQDPE